MEKLRRWSIPACCMLGFFLWAASQPQPGSGMQPPHSHPEEPGGGGGTIEAARRQFHIPVSRGEAHFQLRHQTAREQFLIVVSSLSRNRESFSCEISARAEENPQPTAHATNPPTAQWSEWVRRQQQNTTVAKTRPAKATRRPPQSRTFWIMIRNGNAARWENYRPVQAKLHHVGAHCAIYLDDQSPESKQLTVAAKQVAETFDHQVLPTAQATLGSHVDVDGDGKFAILFSPWLDHLCDDTVSVGGFVRGSDFCVNLGPPLSNGCDMMYLNSSLAPGPHLQTLVAHEYTHAISFSEHVLKGPLKNGNGLEEESWLDESIAHLMENLNGECWTNLDYRISGFLNAPQRYNLVVPDYYNAGLWRGHGHRGSTYLFLRWCVDQHGNQLLRKLIRGSVTGVDNLEIATGRPFEQLYRAWSVSLFESNSAKDGSPSLSLRRELGDRMLAGPRYDYLNLDSGTQRFKLASTATKYFIAHSPGAGGSAVSVVANDRARLQVTVCRLAENLPRLELRAEWANSAGNAVDLVLSERAGEAVELSSLAWENVRPGSNQEAQKGLVSPIHRKESLARLFRTTRLGAGASLYAERVEIGNLVAADREIVFKLSATDREGRPLSAWTSLKVPLLRLASGD